jgi:hypothetical protein
MQNEKCKMQNGLAFASGKNGHAVHFAFLILNFALGGGAAV